MIKSVLFNSFPLLPACTAFPGSHSYRPQTTSSIPPLTAFNRRPLSARQTMSLNNSSYCTHKTMTLHTMTLHTMFTNNFCACPSFPFTNIRLICSLLVEFRTSLFQVLTCLTAAWQQWTPDSDSELDFNGFWPRSLVKTDILRHLWAPETNGLTWLGCPMWTVIRVTPTSASVAMSGQQRFFDIQTSVNLRKFVLSFVSSISLKKRTPVIPFPSERVFNSATFMPMLIPLKTLSMKNCSG